MSDFDHLNVAFILGSPRSGTTLLGDILDLHPDISRWYEPYFILDHHFRDAPDDCLTAEDASADVKQFITDAFRTYQKGSGCQWVIDKSPRNSLKIPFLRAIFPRAKFIHLVRDGRDTVLSIHREWQRRQAIIGAKKRPLQAVQVVWTFINRQPLLRHKIAAIRFEMGGIGSRLKREPYLHKIRWGNRIGWGPRFQGWQRIIDRLTTVEFNALQWKHCVSSILEQFSFLDAKSCLVIKYEDLLDSPTQNIERILNFLSLTTPHLFAEKMPYIQHTNTGKWVNGFSAEEIALIGPILSSLLMQLSYAYDDNWYRSD